MLHTFLVVTVKEIISNFQARWEEGKGESFPGPHAIDPKY